MEALLLELFGETLEKIDTNDLVKTRDGGTG